VAKRNKRKQQRNNRTPKHVTHNQWYMFHTTTPQQIHKTAEQVFGTSKYISYDTFKNSQDYDIIDGYEKNHI
jgi:hypothetical protein